MTDTKSVSADPLGRVNRIVDLVFPLLGFIGLAGALAQAVRGESTARVAASAVGGVTLLGVAIMNLTPVPKSQPERGLLIGVLVLLVLAGSGFTIWFAFE